MDDNTLVAQVTEHVAAGSRDVTTSLGAVRMPAGYALLLNSDGSHYYGLRYDGLESAIHWSRWAVYRWARVHSRRSNDGR